MFTWISGWNDQRVRCDLKENDLDFSPIHEWDMAATPQEHVLKCGRYVHVKVGWLNFGGKRSRLVWFHVAITEKFIGQLWWEKIHTNEKLLIFKKWTL